VSQIPSFKQQELTKHGEDGVCEVCIFGKYVSAALRGTGKYGGAELQMALIAKTLSHQGIRVKIIDTEVTESYCHHTNLAIESVPKWNRGMRGLRLFSHRIPNLFRCLKATDATVYYARGFSFLYLLLLLVAKRKGSKFILAVASDTDLMSFRDRYKTMYRKNASVWGWLSTIIPNELASAILIRGADILLVQHEAQRILAKSRGICAMSLNNILGDDVLHVDTQKERMNNIVVGSLSSIKGLRVLLPLIEELEHVVFEFVGEANDTEGERVKNDLKRHPNVIFHGALNRTETLDKIAGAKALLNTSLAEGFPNTFLEAWTLGTPVISLFVDPGGVIKSNHLGYACDGDLTLFKDLLIRDKYDISETHLRQYVLDHHMPDQAVRFFQGILK
jgi:glycosyltransferase involved in cell wall biosynthesis